jgi:hypothetical protein
MKTLPQRYPQIRPGGGKGGQRRGEAVPFATTLSKIGLSLALGRGYN